MTIFPSYIMMSRFPCWMASFILWVTIMVVRWGRVFQDPMLGTAPTMQILENLALAARRGQRRGLRWGGTKAGKEQEPLLNSSSSWGTVSFFFSSPETSMTIFPSYIMMSRFPKTWTWGWRTG